MTFLTEFLSLLEFFFRKTVCQCKSKAAFTLVTIQIMDIQPHAWKNFANSIKTTKEDLTYFFSSSSSIASMLLTVLSFSLLTVLSIKSFIANKCAYLVLLPSKNNFRKRLSRQNKKHFFFLFRSLNP